MCILRSGFNLASVIQALKPIPAFRVSDRREFQCVGSVAAAVGAGLNQPVPARVSDLQTRHAERHALQAHTQAHTDAVTRAQGHKGTRARRGHASRMHHAAANALTTLCAHNNCITSGSGSLAPGTAAATTTCSCRVSQ